ILWYLVRVNFGASARYEIEPVSLVPSDQEQNGAKPETKPPEDLLGAAAEAGTENATEGNPATEQAPAALSHEEEDVELSQGKESDWQAYTGKVGKRKGSKGWKNTKTGRVVWGARPAQKAAAPTVTEMAGSIKQLLSGKVTAMQVKA